MAARKTVKKARKVPKTVVRRASKKKSAPAMDHDAMMAAWAKASTPAEGHRRLEPMVGSWKARTTFTMAPGAPADVSEGSSENRWVLGGRYLQQTYSGTSMGMPFEGIGYTGYDNVQKKYVGTWMDNFGTGLMDSVGVGRPTESAMSFLAHSLDPSGRRCAFECKVRIQDPNRHSYEMWTASPNGRRFRMMLIEYTRR
jgi:hypothetical protein